MKLTDKSALVTGAGRGIGKGIATCLAEAGAKVLIADIDAESAKETAAEIEAKGQRALALQTDVTDALQVAAMVRTAVEEFGGLDIAVNNAGIVGSKELADIAEAEWDRMLAVNLKSVFLCCKEEAPLMAKNGGGAIVNLASVAGKIGFPGLSHYCASKYAVVGFTNAIAKEYAQQGVRINAICPGLVGTDMWLGDQGLAALWKEEGETVEAAWQRNVASLLPQGVPQTPQDMGETVVFLATAPHIVGQAINIDGGYAGH